MFWNKGLSRYLSQLIIKEWGKNPVIECPASVDQITAHIHAILSEDLNREKELEKEVHILLDQLEKTHSGQFERYKMYPLLKKKLARQKGVIL